MSEPRNQPREWSSAAYWTTTPRTEPARRGGPPPDAGRAVRRVAIDASANEKAARRGDQALRHRLDPRDGRTLRRPAASAARRPVRRSSNYRIELAGLIGWMTTPAAATTTAAWTAAPGWPRSPSARSGTAWTAIGAGAVAAGLLLAALHSVGSAAFQWPGWDRVWPSVLAVLVILAE